ncbi:citrate lyase holo-[acyl-carrier protein] synthase [Clostridium cochlearium]|jgi:holo-ACP synthase|uniref:citrate lyase holo-[acyl-carrier protein] synthase n=1 Tax=Clostridium cochlearium TaxID=1494 RepID=A0A240B010_CLOCO|nr:citrate lyase holo-[acyl-carrier protein] synthase [Clostridium cochlearium]MBU5269872.1 citrate lyase holo-[acyl-carrier protein] synthase [Clostridium cochlearium]MCG4572007.1 citrate lyase holo-[acyl-carrier protein] synthase [Clostridium cochlearium]MCR1971117.1 citrate lyase holo-[acyl-carrier protein] synthase [Clostridium cochlearium]NME95455.1 citrate lyase holo-[acyl-carrier protein] synthase [Clostridium cochlearium]NOH15127.1 citrate lyase holo-[acyl-carrier protein] synthase [Cl
MKDYTAMDILLAREERVEFQNTLLEKYKLPMLCLRVNYPGVIKDNETSRGISNILKAEIEDKFDTQIVYKCYKVTAEGPILILIIDNIAEEIKKYSIYVEQNHLLGRCVDIDVYNVDGTGISRTYLGYKPRKCFICEDMAQNCVRSRKHSMEQVINYIEEQYKKFNNINI